VKRIDPDPNTGVNNTDEESTIVGQRGIYLPLVLKNW